MTRFSHVVCIGLALWGLAACGAAPAPPPAAANLPAPRQQLSRIVERYWDERMSLGNAISPQFMADSLALERRYFAALLAVPRAQLDGSSQLSYDIFKRQRALAVAGFTYPSELLPVDPFDGMPQQLAREAAETAQRPFATPKEYDNWLLRIDDNVQWAQQAIVNMRDGMRRGYVQPRVLIERALPLFESLGQDTAANVFYVPLRTMPDTIKDPQRAQLAASLGSEVKDKLLPAYRALHDFLQREYLPRTRTSIALSALPLGESWYAYRVKRATSTLLTPNEIHAIGKAEVERIRVRMQPLLAAVPDHAQGAANQDIGELLNAYNDLKVQTLAAMPTLFAAVPRADFAIRAIESSLPLSYQSAAPNGAASAILYVGIGAVAARPGVQISSFLQEALPGRHYQSALQLQRTDLPRFRRFGAEPAFVDGWGLYAASLGEELGLYRDDAAKLGALLGQMRCAAALVVDTGLHANGWTRAQALDYLHAQMPIDAAEANLLIDRYVAQPGDALACKMGELKIEALRSRAQQSLGARFDIHEFHTEILKDGAMPLDILEDKMKLWMESSQ